MNVLVTGGAGYIGSHTLVELLEQGHTVVVLDSFINGHPEALERVRGLTGKDFPVVEGDARDGALLEQVFAEHAIDAVIHFAGLKAVGESTQKPLAYYAANMAGTLTLCQAMAKAGVYRLVFSSSATIYGEHATVPYHEDQPRSWPANPYGASKAMVERVLEDLSAADPRWSIAMLRYFNPIGAHSSGQLGEDPQGPPNNLVPYVTQVAVGQRDELAIFGNDYATPDGTCMRDYLHVMDLVAGHLCALKALSIPGCTPYNLGTGHGYSVLELVNTFTQVTGVAVPYRFAPRRAGDLPAFWADAQRAADALGWQPRYVLTDMLADAWRWQSCHPRGFSR